MLLAKVSISRPVMTTMGIMVFVIFGIIGYFKLNLNQMPDVQIPYVTISTIYPGAGPKEIETLISKRIEDVVSTVSLIERVESYSLDGLSIVIIEFQMGKNVDIANQEVKDKVDEILYKLPTDAKKPIIQKVDFKAFPIVDVVLSGNLDPRQLFDIADKTLKDRFSQVEGVANVNISGGQEREIRIELDNRVAFENSVSLPQLLQILKAHNMDIPGGYFQVHDQEYTVRLDGQFKDITTIQELEVPTPAGNKKMRQIANVYDGGKDIRQRTVYYNLERNYKDENIVRLGIIKSTEGNIVKVAEAIVAAIPEIKESLPEGCNLEVVNDESVYAKSSVSDTLGNVMLGVLFTSLVLLLFLANLRSTFIVAITMPVSIISTFMLLNAANLTLNMMTLMGLSVTVGVLVANSVVVIENIFRYKNMGLPNKEAAYKGTKEVAVAVMASTLTNLVVFLPIANMSSMVGQFLKELALAASFATIFSLIFSFTLTPMLASLILPAKTTQGKISDAFDRFYKSWDEFYRRLLRGVLKNKLTGAIAIVVAFVIFVLSMGYYMPKLGFSFLPTMDDGKIKAEIELAQGSNLQATADVINQIEQRLKNHKEVKHILTDLGKKSNLDIGTNLALMNIQLVDVKERTIGVEEMVSIFVKELSSVPNSKIKLDIGSNSDGFESPINFYLMGQDLEKLEELKNIVFEKVKDVPGLINFDHSSRAGKPEITVFPLRDKLSEAGLTVADLALTLRSSIEGMESSKYREYGNEYEITVTLTGESTNSPEKIGNIAIVSPYGGVFRLSQLADVKFTTGYTKILHRDKFTAIQFTGSPAAGVPLGNVTQEIDKRLAEIQFPSGYKISWGGTTKMMNEMIADMGFAFIIAILLTYMLLAALLESFLQPLYILLTIPLAMIGVSMSLYYTDNALGITSMMGIIMLIGIVVNNAILMLDYANQLRRESGLSAKEALIEACPTKLKPIIMSTLALILGMLPMALGIGDAGSEMRVPLGVVSIGGLLVSTIMTLFVIPAFYYVLSSKKKKAVQI